MLNLIVAPKTHNENAEKIAKRIVSFLKTEKIEYAVFFHEKIEDITANVKALVADNESEFVLIGDDPIISTFVNATKDITKIKFGIVPIGGQDDFALSLNLSFNPVQAIKDIIKKEVDNVDYLTLNDQKVISNISIGASAEAKELFDSYKLKNSLTRTIANKKNAAHFEGVELTFYSRGKQPKNEVVFELTIANGGKRNGKNISPLANLKDGLFNFNFVTLVDKKEKKVYVEKQENGEHIYNEKTKQYWLNNIKIYSPNNKIKALVDGKLVLFDEMIISVVENGLKIFRSQNN